MTIQHLSWGYDAVNLRFNTLSDSITIDADHGQAVYTAIDIIIPALTGRMTNYYLLLATGKNQQEAELNLETYGTSGKVGVFAAVYQAGIFGYFDAIPVLVGHTYARRISIDAARNQMVYTLTDTNTRQTQTLTHPLTQGTSAPFDAVDVGVEWWDDSGRAHAGTFQPQVDATVRNLAVDGRQINPSSARFATNNPGLVPFKVVGGSYVIRGISQGVGHHSGLRFFKISRRNARLRS